MMPAHQRFQAHDAAAFDIDLRLVQKKELVRDDGLAEFRVKAYAFPDLEVHGFGKKTISSAPLRLARYSATSACERIVSASCESGS